MIGLFSSSGDSTVRVEHVNPVLAERHYLGEAGNGLFAWADDDGVMVFANPRSRRLPQEWLELVRWCITGGPNAGSRQWARFTAYAHAQLRATTVVSYSDPGRGHTGALYRACNWLWAPTWHRLRPPPSGNGSWKRTRGVGACLPYEPDQGPKDRWVFPLSPDPRRAALLGLQDGALRHRFPWAEYREPSWRRDRFDPATGGGDFKRWTMEQAGE